MQIGKNIFMSRLGDLTVQGAKDLGAEIQKAVIRSDGITILSAYSGTKYLLDLLESIPKKNRRKYAIRLVFGFEMPSALPSAIGSLRQFRKDLIERGFRKIEVKSFNRGAPFHTKLYLFVNNYQKTWFVGSANASSAIEGARHEMMLRLRGPHEALSDYVRQTIKLAIPIENDQPVAEATDIRSLLLLGELCYQPQWRMSFSFEACQITSEDRIVLKKSLAEISSVLRWPPFRGQIGGFAKLGSGLRHAAISMPVEAM